MADNPTTCPFCNDTILIPEEFLGSEVECPSCHKQFFIPKVKEEISSGSIDSPAMGEFDCPLCGGKNQISENFSGKMKCKSCHKEIEVINEAMIPCPHCGKLISGEDTTCIFCQRSLSEPPLSKEEKAVSRENVPTPAAKTVKIETPVIPEFQEEEPDKEDAYVLNTLQRSKRLSIILFIVIAVFCLIGIVLSLVMLRPEPAAAAVIVLLISGVICSVSYFTSCYRHGIYKNIMQIRIAAEKMSGTQK